MTSSVDLKEFVDGFIAESEQLVASANAAVDKFEKSFATTKDLRKRTVRVLSRYTDKGNIAFDSA